MTLGPESGEPKDKVPDSPSTDLPEQEEIEYGSPGYLRMVEAEIARDFGRIRGRDDKLDSLLAEFDEAKGSDTITPQYVAAFSSFLAKMKELEKSYKEANAPSWGLVETYYYEFVKVELILKGLEKDQVI